MAITKHKATILEIKNGTIILPKKLQCHWSDAILRLHEYGADQIILERDKGDKPDDKPHYSLAAWKRARGILKSGTLPDAVAWQRKIRREWDRKLP